MRCNSSTAELKLTTPDDWHLHVRDGDNMRSVVPHSALQFDRAVIMPNLLPPVTTTAKARADAAVSRACCTRPDLTPRLSRQWTTKRGSRRASRLAPPSPR